MYYLIGDIHGYIDKLNSIYNKLNPLLNDDDIIIFLGDYIDRGDYSYEVIDYLIAFSKRYKSIFLKGNHEDMLLDYISGKDKNGIYLYNGGDITIKSYIKNCGSFIIPKHHEEFYNNLQLYFEGDDFIAVHAGLDPKVDTMEEQSDYHMLWIRDQFFRGKKRWDKTIIFGHTPVSYITHDNIIYIDEERNIIGIDSGVYFGKSLICMRWPDRMIITS